MGTADAGPHLRIGRHAKTKDESQGVNGGYATR
jgi:hypothetical protein